MLATDLDIDDEVKPAIEVLRGERSQKVSPRTTHALLQGRLFRLLEDWCHGAGIVGTEWRFYYTPERGLPSSLVPDVAYVANDRLPAPSDDGYERPTVPPDIVVEILSPGDRAIRIARKLELHREFGVAVVFVIDPERRTIRVIDADGDCIVPVDGVASSRIFPTLAIDGSTLFRKRS